MTITAFADKNITPLDAVVAITSVETEDLAFGISAGVGLQFTISIGALPSFGTVSLVRFGSASEPFMFNWELQLQASGFVSFAVIVAGVGGNTDTFRSVTVPGPGLIQGGTYTVGVFGTRVVISEVGAAYRTTDTLSVFAGTPLYDPTYRLVVRSGSGTAYEASYTNITMFTYTDVTRALGYYLDRSTSSPNSFWEPYVGNGNSDFSLWYRTNTSEIFEGDNTVLVGSGFALSIIEVVLPGDITVDTLKTDVSYDTLIELVNSAGVSVASNDDSGPAYLSSITAAVTPGVYYLLSAEWDLIDISITVTVSGGLTKAAPGSGGANYAAYAQDVMLGKTMLGGLHVEDPLEGLESTYLNLMGVTSVASRESVLAPMKTALGLAGTLTVNGSLHRLLIPVSRVVRLYDRDSGELVTSTVSDSVGNFAFTGLSAGEYYVTGHDFGILTNSTTVQNLTII